MTGTTTTTQFFFGLTHVEASLRDGLIRERCGGGGGGGDYYFFYFFLSLEYYMFKSLIKYS